MKMPMIQTLKIKMTNMLKWLKRAFLPAAVVAAIATPKTAVEVLLPDVDWAFIASLEGTRLKGYVPLDKRGKVLGMSGVTIASGVDLGQQNLLWLKSLELPITLEQKLKPYLGLKKEAAVTFLKDNPLSITSNEAVLLNKAVKSKMLASLIGDWDTAVPQIPFASLPKAVQTALASVHYQYGNLPRRTPNFWKVSQKAAKTNDYSIMVAHLLNFGDSYKTRRKKEADLIRNSTKTMV